MKYGSIILWAITFMILFIIWKNEPKYSFIAAGLLGAFYLYRFFKLKQKEKKDKH